MNRLTSRRAFAAFGLAAVAAAVGGGRASAQPDRRFDRWEDVLDRRLDYLHYTLRITPEQDGAWRAFADAVRDEERRRDDIRLAARDARDWSVVERLEERRRALDERSQGLDRLLRALRPLYASFSNEQKRIADREMFRPGAPAFTGMRRPRFGPGEPGFFRYQRRL